MIATETTSVVLVGVGGQGILLASEILAQAAVAVGFDVKTNEVHGMAQRGGSVIAQIRYGEKVNSPLVTLGTASVLGALEQVEALRHRDYLAPDGLAVVSDQRIVPVTVSSGQTKYPELNEAEFKKYFPRLVYVNVLEMAAELGNSKASNTILLGAISGRLKLPPEAWETAIRNSVKEKFIDVNLKAFQLGCGLVTDRESGIGNRG